jgi:nucleolar GTP-binding protein
MAKFTKADTTVSNARNRARKHGVETLDTISKSLCIPLRDIVNGYRYELKALHPFEKVVADLTARAREKKDGLTLMDVLDDVNEARKELLIAGKDWIAKCKNAESAREAMEVMNEGEEQMYSIFMDLASNSLLCLIDLQKSLRTVPAVRLDTPAVVLVGSPNVGKSSIVRAISSATPEVNNYPFTTRGMTLGHVQVFWENETTAAAAVIPEISEKKKGRFNVVDDDDILGNYAFSQLCQVMDSPGLLVRPDNERNEMEALTLAAMQHLPTAVMYVMDLSGGAGDRCSSVEDQLILRKEVRARFPRRPWIDVVSKCDLGIVEGVEEKLREVLNGAPYLEVSIKEGTGVDELRDAVMRMLGEVRVVLDAMAAVDVRSARPSK